MTKSKDISGTSRKEARKQARMVKKSKKPTLRSKVKVNAIEIQNQENKLTKAQMPGRKSSQVKSSIRLPVKMDPYIADEDREIARLEKLLGINSSKDRGKSASKLSREYSKYEGIDGDLGDFLMELDDLSQSVISGKKTPSKIARSIVEDVSQESKPHVLSDDDQELSDIDYDDMDSETNFNRDDDRSDTLSMEEGSDHDMSENEGSRSSRDSVEVDEDEEQSFDEDSGDEMNDEAGDAEVDLTTFTYQPTQGEDIYGRIIESETSTVAATKYIPPGKRALLATVDESSEQVRLLRRQINGLMNRLSEQSKDMVLKGLRDLYATNSSIVTNLILKDAIIAACGNRTQVMVSLIPLYAALVAGLHITIGMDISAYLLENIAVLLFDEIRAYRQLSQSDINGNSCKCACNYLLLLIYLYNLRICHSQLIADILSTISTGVNTENRVQMNGSAANDIGEMELELLLLIIDHCGMVLRSDDPASLKFVVLALSRRVGENDSTRFKVMIESITDLKNNKSRRNQNVNLEIVKSYRKWLGSVKAGALNRGREVCLQVSLKDLLDAEKKGRWWKAGASWVGHSEGTQDEENKKSSFDDSKVSTTAMSKSIGENKEEEKLLRIAKKMRMNTATRRGIFVIIMSSRDINDSYERLLKLDLKGSQDREIIKVLVECCAQEKTYNPFYAELASVFCTQNRQFKTTMQYTYWDILKVIKEQQETTPERRCVNLGRLLSQLICSFHVPLAVIKVIDVTDLNEAEEIFLVSLFLGIFTQSISDESFRAVFDRVATSKDFAMVRDITLIFLQRNMSNTLAGLSPEDLKLVMKRKKIAIGTMEAMEVLNYVMENEERGKKKNQRDADFE